MKSHSRNAYLPSPSGKLSRFLVAITILGLILSGCNFPQATAEISPANQRQTEVAGILNPEGMASESTTPSLLTPEPTLSLTQSPTDNPLEGLVVPEGYRAYVTQQGDTLPALTQHFSVDVSEIQSDAILPAQDLLEPGTVLLVPDVLGKTLSAEQLLPDSEIHYGPTVGDFDTIAFAQSWAGYLMTYTEEIHGEILTGPEIIQLAAIESSINPRLLLAFVEFRSGWVTSHPEGASLDLYPLGFGAGADTGLYKELQITAKLLALGYYGWRDGELRFMDYDGGGTGRLDPTLNAGTVALLRLFSTLYTIDGVDWALYDPAAFLTLYRSWFGDPWQRAAAVEPYLFADTQQPELVFPFTPGEAWSLTSGPHISWQTGTPRGALDFAPITGESQCAVSFRWVTAAASGLVVRSERGVVAIDLDGDGDEGTGWVLLYLHVAEQDRVAVGTWLERDDPVGHPSCEGGNATGTHLHFTRKFNGEWLGVSEPLPLVISGWQAVAGEKRYEGYLFRGNDVIQADPNGMGSSLVIRED
ncbi:hypothetical protein JR338_11105 [Chloroflexota bacterium]|nr:hypothetical protein JR338_11105 [Chloroflexota bacterium]